MINNSQSRLASVVGSQAGGLQTSANPLDVQSSVDIAASVAGAANMQEKYAVANQADSMSISLLAASESTASTVSKPQIVVTDFKSSKDIKAYVTKEGDTIPSIAAAYGISSDSIRWSNDLRGDAVAVGKTLYLPPVNGIVYTVKAGDTPASLAATYSANAEQIIAYNDAEISGLQVGSRALIPNGQQRAAVVIPSVASTGGSSSYGLSYSFSATYGGNGYVPGYCTYYVASRIAVPTNWGNANTWASGARMTPGWTVSARPVPGAIAQNSWMAGGLGHVAVVESVSEDGSQIMISDMNYGGRWSTRTNVWVSTSEYSSYIYR